jgi:hypothetical protein
MVSQAWQEAGEAHSLHDLQHKLTTFSSSVEGRGWSNFGHVRVEQSKL